MRRLTHLLVSAPLALAVAAALIVAPVADRPAAAQHRPRAGSPPTGFGADGTPARPASERYVREAYQGLLGRDADAAGLAYWGGLLDDGLSRGTFARQIVLAPETVRREVRALYQVLDREPATSELDDDVAAVRARTTSLEAILLRLVSSNEYFDGPGGGEPETYVRVLYADVLDRAVPDDDPGLAHWTERLTAGAPRASVARGFVLSQERLLPVIGAAYDRILARAGDEPGLAFWLGQIRAGRSILDVSRDLLASAEAWSGGCSILDTRRCLLPFPNDELTVADPSTDTGRRLLLKPGWAPRANNAPEFDTTEWNRQDGFSPGSAIMFSALGAPPAATIDLEESGAPPITDIARSLAPDSPIVLVDMDTGERWPFWAEIDSNAPDDTERAIVIRPARNLLDGHTYAVGIGAMRDASGAAIAAPSGFRIFRDQLPSTSRRTNERRAGIEAAIDEVVDAGLERGTLHLAWSFTVASTRNLAERIIHMRDETLSGPSGAVAPEFTVSKVEPRPGDQTTRVEGSFQVPNYLSGAGATGSTMRYGDDALPQASGTLTANFICTVPDSSRTEPARPSLYGHGLLGSANEANSTYARNMAREHNMVYCGTNWIGMAGEDLPTVFGIVNDLSRFPQLSDRTQQGYLNFMVLGRLMTLPDGLVSHVAFQGDGGAPAIDGSALYYDGISQGGVMGGGLVAVSPDVTRGALGVPAMNYSTLLERSVDFDPFFAILANAYPSALDRIMMISVIQMLWDRGETNGYANHLTSDPLPGTPDKEVLMHVAYGDHQVAPVAADVEARTIGAATTDPPVPPGRLPDVTPLWGIDRIEEWPHSGSAIIYWDSGAAPPPLTNVPPREGRDPHSDPRADPRARAQISQFLQPRGVVVDVCEGGPCVI